MSVMSVPITKGKSTVDIDTDSIPPDVWAAIVAEGLKVVLNKGMSKITKETYPVAEELAAKAMEKANENVAAVLDGSIKLGRASKKAKGVSGAVMTEARRLAKNIVKDTLKANKLKISHYAASEITKAANALIEEDSSILEQAKKNIEDREKAPLVPESILKSIAISPTKVAAAEAKKAKDGTISAKQAGMTAKAKKPQGATAH